MLGFKLVYVDEPPAWGPWRTVFCIDRTLRHQSVVIAWKTRRLLILRGARHHIPRMDWAEHLLKLQTYAKTVAKSKAWAEAEEET